MINHSVAIQICMYMRMKFRIENEDWVGCKIETAGTWDILWARPLKYLWAPSLKDPWNSMWNLYRSCR